MTADDARAVARAFGFTVATLATAAAVGGLVLALVQPASGLARLIG